MLHTYVSVSAPRGHVTRGAEAERLLGPYFFTVFEVSTQIFTHFILLASRSFNMVSSRGQSSAERCEHNSNMSLRFSVAQNNASECCGHAVEQPGEHLYDVAHIRCTSGLQLFSNRGR